MRIIEIQANANGSHSNTESDFITAVPDGWARIPADVTVPSSFPFVDLEAEQQEDEMVVVSMTAQEVPEEKHVASESEALEAQVFYTAVMTDTALAVEKVATLGVHSYYYERIKGYYDLGLWTDENVRAVASKGLIAQDEVVEICG